LVQRAQNVFHAGDIALGELCSLGAENPVFPSDKIRRLAGYSLCFGAKDWLDPFAPTPI
jgi:hypothetical protein